MEVHEADILYYDFLILGPQAPSREIEVYLRPMIDELKELWEQGVQTYDYMIKSMFNLRASVIWTINDFSAYGNLSGWSTKAFLAKYFFIKSNMSRNIYSTKNWSKTYVLPFLLCPISYKTHTFDS